MNVFRHLLGDDTYKKLPKAVQDYHDHKHSHFTGTAFSGGTNNPIANTVRRLFGFPALADTVSVSIELDIHNGRDRWQRNFGGRRFASSFFPHLDGSLDERFSPFRFRFQLRHEGDKLYWDFVGWSLGSMPLPKLLGPRIVTWETASPEGGFEFYSHADFPAIGRLVHYHGIVTPTDEGR
ncbi:MAG: DUF4166 domain-containing protein [Sulfitobacter sp.]